MAQYKTDLRDINFTLFEQLKVQDQIEDYSANDLKDIVLQFDKFVEGEIFPSRVLGDEEGVRLTKDGVLAPECFKAANKSYYANGWFGLGLPEDIGGMPVPEAVRVACSSLYIGANIAYSMYPGLSIGVLNVIRLIGTEAQKNQLIPLMMDGRMGGTMCLTEAGAGSDVGASKATAIPADNNLYKIKGVKIFISGGESDLYDNNIHLVLARTPNAPEGTKGLSLFIVPRYRINADGSVGEANNVKCTKIEEKMGIHGSATCEITFGADGDCYGELIGEEFAGMPNMFLLMNEARLMCGTQGEGQANLVTILTEQYAKERVQFDKEIYKHPDVKRMLLKMRSLSRGMRSMNLYLSNLFDTARLGDKEAEEEIALLTPICKSFCTDEGFNVSVEAIQVHGGYGYCTEYGIEQFARDTKIASIYEGTNGIQAIDFVMRKILRDEGKAFNALAAKMTKTLSQSHADFSEEATLMADLLGDAQKIVGQFAALASENKIDLVLSGCTDFQNYCANLIVAWRLLDAANIAMDGKAQANNDDERSFYQSKIADFKFFCRHLLTRNVGYRYRFLNLDEVIPSLEL